MLDSRDKGVDKHSHLSRCASGNSSFQRSQCRCTLHLARAGGVVARVPLPCPDKAAAATLAQVEEIAKIKLPDLNTNKLQSAMNTVMGTAKNMGITVED